MKEKIILVVIGVLIGALLASSAFLIFSPSCSSSKNIGSHSNGEITHKKQSGSNNTDSGSSQTKPSRKKKSESTSSDSSTSTDSSKEKSSTDSKTSN